MNLITRLFASRRPVVSEPLSFTADDLRALIEADIERGWGVPLPHLPLSAEQIAHYNRQYPGYQPYGFPTEICEQVGWELKERYPELTWSYRSFPKGYHVFYDVRYVGQTVLPFTDLSDE